MIMVNVHAQIQKVLSEGVQHSVLWKYKYLYQNSLSI